MHPILSCWICLTIGLAAPQAGEPRAATPQRVGTLPTVELKLRTGGTITGQVVDSNDHGLVIVQADTPFVFAWIELDGGSAYSTSRTILIEERGGLQNVAAADHFQLGLFALLQERVDLAQNAFTAASRIDPKLKRRGENALAEHGRRSRELSAPTGPAAAARKPPPSSEPSPVNTTTSGAAAESDLTCG